MLGSTPAKPRGRHWKGLNSLPVTPCEKAGQSLQAWPLSTFTRVSNLMEDMFLYLLSLLLSFKYFFLRNAGNIELKLVKNKQKT